MHTTCPALNGGNREAIRTNSNASPQGNAEEMHRTVCKSMFISRSAAQASHSQAWKTGIIPKFLAQGWLVTLQFPATCRLTPVLICPGNTNSF